MTRIICIFTLTLFLPFNVSAKPISLKKVSTKLFKAMIDGNRTEIDKSLMSFEELKKRITKKITKDKYQRKINDLYYRISDEIQKEKTTGPVRLIKTRIKDVMILPAGGKLKVEMITALVKAEIFAKGKKTRSMTFAFYRIGQTWKASVR